MLEQLSVHLLHRLSGAIQVEDELLEERPRELGGSNARDLGELASGISRTLNNPGSEIAEAFGPSESDDERLARVIGDVVPSSRRTKLVRSHATKPKPSSPLTTVGVSPIKKVGYSRTIRSSSELAMKPAWPLPHCIGTPSG